MKDDSDYEPVLDSRGKKIPHFTRHTKTGIFYFRKTFKKIRIPPLQFSTEEDTLGRARTKVDVEIQRHKNRHLGIDDSRIFGSTRVRTFRDAAEAVLKFHTPEQRVRTQENHRLYIPQLIEILGSRDINSITSESLKEVVRAIKSNKRFSKAGKALPPRTTFMDYAKNMNLVMRYAYQKKWSTHDIKFKNPDVKKETGRLLRRTEVEALWDAMNEDTRDQYVLALECVMRLREVICAPWSEINLTSGEWTLSAARVKTGSKTGKGRCFIVSPNALLRLRARFDRRDKRSPCIFPSPQDPTKPIWSIKTAWRNAKIKAGIRGPCRWHDLRHTGLTWMLLGDPRASQDEQLRMVRPPMRVSAYAGVSMKTIENVYLKRRSSQSIDVSQAVSIY
jgi:integrase